MIPMFMAVPFVVRAGNVTLSHVPQMKQPFNLVISLQGSSEEEEEEPSKEELPDWIRQKHR